jgi:hypothetical protein
MGLMPNVYHVSSPSATLFSSTQQAGWYSTGFFYKGTWEVSFALPPGRYEHRFWVDEVWLDDPNSQERVENPFGSQNCVRMMS